MPPRRPASRPATPRRLSPALHRRSLISPPLPLIVPWLNMDFAPSEPLQHTPYSLSLSLSLFLFPTTTTTTTQEHLAKNIYKRKWILSHFNLNTLTSCTLVVPSTYYFLYHALNKLKPKPAHNPPLLPLLPPPQLPLLPPPPHSWRRLGWVREGERVV